MRFADTELLWQVEGVYTAAECARMIERIEAWVPALATNNPLYRDQDRVMRDEPQIAADLFTRLRPSLPAAMGRLTLWGLNERLRFYRYGPGQRFDAHTDHWYQPDDRHITLLSVLLYLNGDFEGGETRFVEPLEHTLVPRSGLVAVFQHKVRHEGCAVRAGRKYVVRSDVIYEAPSPIRRTFAED